MSEKCRSRDAIMEENGITDTSVLEDAYISAVRFIKYRPRSILEVRKRMKLKGYSRRIGEITIKRLLDEGILDDTAFARMWALERAEAGNFGPLRIKNELVKKGIDHQLITAILEELSDDENTLERAVKLLTKKYRDLKLKDDRSLILFLIRGGYNYSQAREAVKRALKKEND